MTVNKCREFWLVQETHKLITSKGEGRSGGQLLVDETCYVYQDVREEVVEHELGTLTGKLAVRAKKGRQKKGIGYIKE